MAGVLGGGLASVVLVLAFLAWIVSGRALRSVRRLTERAERVDPRDLRDGLPVPDGDAELSQLVLALNRMLSRLHNSHATELAFAANAGHRLRTPVATLRAEAELALGDSDPSHRTAALHQIIADADQLTFIVDRMLARSRPPGSGSTPTIAVFERAATRWQRQASIAGVDLTVVAPSGLSRELRCPELLEILDPIVDNAVRHTDPGGHILISAQLLPASGAQPELLIEVANTGHPVPADLAAHIFDAWFSTREGSQAGGLGLWVARETARDVGGDVWLTEERPGTTTRFEIRLPTLP